MEGIYGGRRHLGKQRELVKCRGSIERVRRRVWKEQQRGETTGGSGR